MDSEVKVKVAKMISNILLTGVCPNTPRSVFARNLLWAHNKGYLFTNKNEDVYILAYRIPEWEEKWSKQMPEEEKGSVLYCAMAVSISKNPICLLKILRDYCEENEVKELIYYKRNSDSDFKRIPIRSKSHV